MEQRRKSMPFNKTQKPHSKGLIPSLLKALSPLSPIKINEINRKGLAETKNSPIEDSKLSANLANRIKQNAEVLQKSIMEAINLQDKVQDKMLDEENIDEQLLYNMSSFHFGSHDDEFQVYDMEEMKKILLDFLGTVQGKKAKKIPILEYKDSDKNFDETNVVQFCTSIKRANGYQDLVTKYALQMNLKQRHILTQALDLVGEIKNSNYL